MTAFLLRRLLQGLVVLALVSVLVFGGIYVVGDPTATMIPDSASPATRRAMIAALGLDRPLWAQYMQYAGSLLHGHLGRSFLTGLPVEQMLAARLPATLELSVIAMLAAIVVGIPLGLLSGARPDGVAGRSIAAGASLAFSLPSFWVGLMLIGVFSVWLGWLPSNGRGPTQPLLGVQVSFTSWQGLRYLILPAANLALFSAAMIVRMTRACTAEVMPSEYIRFARAKGLRGRRVIGVHVLKNILIPIVTVIGINFGGIIAFSVVTETIFGWPGMGKLLYDSIVALDRPVVVGYLLFVAALYLVINFVVDLMYTVLDPRVRIAQASA